MKLVIEISETLKKIADEENIKTFSHFMWSVIVMDAIKNGTLLPKGHGRIKDIDKIEWYRCTFQYDCPHEDRECKDCNRAECSKTQVDAIPTIIEADRGE